MNQDPEVPQHSGSRYSAKRLLHLVDFFCRAPRAQRVSLVGDFNNWDPSVHAMERTADGCWRLRIELHHGHHQYVFLVDGKPTLDPHAQGKVRRPPGREQPPFETVSLLAVS